MSSKVSKNWCVPFRLSSASDCAGTSKTLRDFQWILKTLQDSYGFFKANQPALRVRVNFDWKCFDLLRCSFTTLLNFSRTHLEFHKFFSLKRSGW